MSPAIFVLLIFLVLMVLAAVARFWWISPQDRVPGNAGGDELRRIEVQDRIRQTNYQILTALGLGGTFVITLAQFWTSIEHWRTDFESKSTQERAAQYLEAVKQIDHSAPSAASSASSEAATEGAASSVAAIRTLLFLGTRYPEEYHPQAHSILSAYLLTKTLSKHVLRESQECRNDFGLSPTQFQELLNMEQTKKEQGHEVPQDREEPSPSVQSAINAVGDPKFSQFRLHSEGGGCSSPQDEKYALKLEHAIFDDLDLSGRDLSCSLLSQTKFRRASLNSTNLSFSDLRGADFSDFHIPGTPAWTGAIRDRLYSTDVALAPPQWKKYRCWVADLRGANLSNANLEGAILAGADLTDANLTGANLCRVDVSRANFTGAKISPGQLRDACAGKPGSDETTLREAQPFGLAEPVRVCGRFTCEAELALAKSNKPSVTDK
ncbi:pentapeptide repeat-containing protein [Bradyrhizobium oligotrophicum S58]